MGADVVFLQEVLGTHEEHGKKWGDSWPEAPHYEFLADSIWPQFAYGRNMVYPKGHHGNAIMSKFPIVHYENHDVSVAGPEKRGLLHCILRIPGHALDVHAICVHLGLSESHRVQQIDLLCEMVRSEVPDNAPLVVAGDFNDWRRRCNAVLEREIGLIEHMQIAGPPHRNEPDTGELNYPYLFEVIDRLGYRGWIGAEYRPKAGTRAGLGWAKPYGIG